MKGPFRLARGGRIDRSRTFTFRFDGRRYEGHPGDTLASALLANGVRIVGRSFKYHRPRGILTAGFEEPSALIELGVGARREPNLPATTVELFEGLEAASQNRWPTLAFDLGAVSGFLSGLLPAGFYYKTFMWPPSWWEKLYEPLIRRAAGLGRAALEPDPDRYETIHAHCDVLVVGAGRSGVAAAQAAAVQGARVIVADQDFDLVQRAASLAPGVLVLPRTMVFGLYDHGVAGAVERVSDHWAEPARGRVRQRQWVIRAGETIVATGALERLVAFAGNDRPGVMLASAAATYAERFGVAAGRRAAFLVNNDQAYDSAFALARAGIDIAAIIDVRREAAAGRRAQAAGLRVLPGCEVARAHGVPLCAIEVRRIGERHRQRLAVDLLCVSGGFTPQTQLASQARAAADVRLVGRAAGEGLDATAQPFFEVKAPGKAFVDLQNDVTAEDIRLAHREGYSHIEHAKRYTTHGMGTDQGKTGGLLGAAVLAEARGLSLEAVGLPTARPYASPVAWGALAGGEVGRHFRPQRLLPLHDWHAENGATFARLGLWLRPLVYSPSGDSGWEAVLAEARAVRRAVGITDVSSLGKIDVQGKDAAIFLDRIYANTFSTLPVGRARYGLMLREDGIVLDDGTTSRLAPDHYFVTTTTANAATVLEHMEFHLQTVWPELEVTLTAVADQWAQFAVAGPRASAVVAQVVEDLDLAQSAFPFMAAAEARIGGVPGRLFRISFSGECAFEVSVPASEALPIWEALLAAGAPFGIRPYGLDALNLLRIEKGHVAGSEINGQTTAHDLGLSRMLKKNGDFIGRVLAERPGLVDAKRPGLVGLRVLDSSRSVRAGAHLVRDASSRMSQGVVTAACPQTEGEGFIGLALLAGGPARIGEVLHASDPVRGEACDVAIVSPHFVDPDNTRVRAGSQDDLAPGNRRSQAVSIRLDRGGHGGGPIDRRRWPGILPMAEARDGSTGGVRLSERLLDVVEVTARPGVDARAWPTDPSFAALIGEGRVLPIAPARVLLTRRRGAAGAFAAEIEAGLGEQAHVVDQSGGTVALRLTGEKARWALSKGCRIDLDPRSFGQQAVARTIIAQVPVIVYQVNGDPTFELLAPLTLARSFTEFLLASAADVGCVLGEPDEDETR
jgi:sarcosine oxidase subunit alpha